VRPAAPAFNLPDRRSFENPQPAAQAANGHAMPNPPRPQARPVPQRPLVSQLPGGPEDRSSAANEEKVSMLMIVGLGLIACVVGWLVAGWFN
jgi:hypothetical protein